MANFNKVMLMGNLTRDPQLSYTPNQTPVVDFGLATNRRWTGQDGSQREETCFVERVLWTAGCSARELRLSTSIAKRGTLCLLKGV